MGLFPLFIGLFCIVLLKFAFPVRRIILDSTITSVMLANPDTGESIIVEVKADEVFDVGTLTYENLLIPGYN